MIEDDKSMKQDSYAEVILPLPLALTFTYHIPENWRGVLQEGSRVIVPFGKQKVYAGIVDQLHSEPSRLYEAKDMLDAPDKEPIFQRVQLDFMWWLASYYMCHIGEVLQAAMPAGFKVSSESLIQLNPDADEDFLLEHLADREWGIITKLKSTGTLSYDQVAELTGLKSPYPVIKKLLKADAILLLEKVKDRYVPKTEKRIRFHPNYLHAERLQQLLNELERREKQQEVVLYLLQQMPVLRSPEANQAGLPKAQIKARCSDSALNTLLKKEVLEEFEIRLSRFPLDPNHHEPELQLSPRQTEVRHEVLKALDEKGVALLHGVTGSGKTEVLIQMIKDTLQSGHQVLFLLPEIALTTQLAQRLKRFFGDVLGIYHSRYSENERVEVWRGVLEGRFQVVAGVRSSIFLPFDDLGLIIVDEEHEASYKQFDPAPRYHARDMALVLARYHQCPVILSSATPSLESFYLAQSGKYGLIKLEERFGGLPLPKISFAEPPRVEKGEQVLFHFGERLRTGIEAALQAGEQVILFQNRRGYAPYLQCSACSWIPKCENCAVSLTYHQYNQELRCHYCGFKKPLVRSCEACSSTAMQQVGFGTQRIEEEARLLFPQARIQRMDVDTTRSRDAIENIINDFASAKIDILIGTQMVSKGLDFEKVSLVGVMDADHMIHFPDFRAHERAFQMLTQVSGRSGRKKEQGRVLMQTRDYGQEVLQWVQKHDYEGFYKQEIEERKQYFYPPFARIILIRVKALDKALCQQGADRLYDELRLHLPEDVTLTIPHEPLVNKVRNRYIRELLLFFPREFPQKRLKNRIQKGVDLVKSEKEFGKIRIILDVDPV